jgi:hypothetical protein
MAEHSDMMSVDPAAALALATALILMLSLAAARRRRGRVAPSAQPSERNWTPQAARVLTVAERRAHALLCQVLPGYLVLAQVPLTRFLRAEGPTHEWLQHVNGLSADLLLCDSGSRVLAVVDVRPNHLSSGSRKRQARMTKLLRDAGIKVLCWDEEALPDLATARQHLLPLLAAPSVAREAATPVSRPMPLIPVAEVLADGDAAAQAGDAMEPVNSALFEDFELQGSATTRR